jgi:hypothetical protein
MTARIANVSFHAENPGDLARFWCAVMGYPAWVAWEDDEVAELRASGMTEDEIADRAEAWDGDPAHQRFYFSRYRHERRQRNRVHVDVQPFEDHRASHVELRAEADRLVAIGASIEKVLDGRWGPYDEFCIMMRDPEGNEFCLQ